MKRKSISNLCRRIGAGALAFVMAAASLPAMYVQAETTTAEESTVELPTKDSVKFASFNIAAVHQPDEETRTAMLKQLEDNDIDIAGLQEIDMNTSRNDYEMLEFFRGETYPDIFFKKNIDFGGGEYGVGTVSKVEIKEKTGGFLTTPSGLEQRGWQRSLIEVEGEEIAFYNTHLIYGSKGPISVQIQELIAMLDADPAEYKVVVGDFNVDMGKDMLYPFMGNYVLANGYEGVWYDTFNEPIDGAENYAIDNIIVSRNIKIKSVHREDNLLSDHDMIWAECELLDEEVTSTQYLDIVLEEARALDANKCYEETYAPVGEILAEIDAYTELPEQEEVNAAAAALAEALEGVVQIPTKDTNLAAGKAASAQITKITDGNYSNYWSGEQYPQSFVIDLEDVYEVEKMVAFPYVGGDRYYHYNISVSTDGASYTQVAEKTDDTPEVSEGTAYEFEEAVSARYVKVEMNFNSNNSAVHMREFDVYAKDVSGELVNVSSGKKTEASGIFSITDGSTSSYWDGGAYPNYFVIDLGYTYPVNKFVATPYNSGSRYYHYYIEVSEDGQNYTKVAEKTDNSAEVAEGKTFTLEEPVNARYVKVTMTYNSSNSAVHMREFAVYPYVEETVTPTPEPTPGEVQTENMFDKNSDDNWLKALSYGGQKYVVSGNNYDNMFATHKIYASAGDTLYWGNMGKENYVAEMYDANDGYIGQITFADTNHESTGNTVAGVKGTIVEEFRHSYTITNENVAYIRFFGNISTIDSFQVYANLPNGFDDFPGRPKKINVYEDMEALVYADESGASMPYRLYVPEDYDASKTYPVLVFLHGAGERGTDNSAQLVNGIQQLFDTHKAMRDAIVIAPQCPDGKRWVETDWDKGSYDSDAIKEEQLAVVMNLLADVCDAYSADEDRIYAMGLSMGGYGTWNLLMNHSDVFAAGIPICGGADPDKADTLKEIPIWAFHGNADAVVPYQATVDIVDAIKAAGGQDILFTTYDGAGHNIWNTAAVEDGLIDWLFSKRLSDRNAPDNLFDKNHYDNWKQALTYNGDKLVNTTNYANMFATHPIEVSVGDVLAWGPFALENYVMEVYDADHKLVRQVQASETEKTALGTQAAGVGGKLKDEYRFTYTIVDETAAYVRILGNLSTMDSYMVFKNMEANGQKWPAGYQPKKSVLTNKSVLFCGDSITNAVKDTAGLRGWAGRIGEGYDMIWTNAGVSGASASTCRGSNRVIAQLEKNAANDYDYLILHAGVNDAMDSAEVGTVSDSFAVSDFDTSTYAGGLEELFYYACKHYEGSRIGFIINYATPNSNWGGRTKDMSEYFEIAKAVCDKWGIPYIDLYSGTIEVAGKELSYSYDIINVLDKTAFYNNDAAEVHIGGIGYDRISPYLAEWMKTLEVTDTEIIKDDNVAFNGTAYAQSTLGSYVASRLNDDSTSGLWIAETNAVPVYCGISFEETVNVYGLQLVAETRATLGANVMEYYIEAKVAEDTWQVIYTGDTFDEEAQSYTTNITLDKIVKTDDIRVTFTSNGGIYPALAELRVYATDEEPEYEFAILTQPENAAAVKGENAEVTVKAVGEGLSYTWYYKNPGNKKFYVSGDDFVIGDGSSYSIPMAAWRDGQEVYCEITDAYGTVLQSNVVTLRMEEAVTGIEIVKQPVDVAADNGKLVVVSVEAKGEGLTYTWYYKNPGNVKFYESGDQFVSVGGTQYAISMAAWRDGQEVYCVITDANGDSVQTNTVTLTMVE